MLEDWAGDNKSVSPPAMPTNEIQNHSQWWKSAFEDEDDLYLGKGSVDKF